MDCSSCGPETQRQDRPHLFFCHDTLPCPSCEVRTLARIVFRDGKVVALIRCNTCGPKEREISDDAEAYRQDFLHSGRVPADHVGDWHFKTTT